MIWHLRVKSPKTGAGRHALPTKSGSLLPAALYSNLKSVRPRTRKSAAYRCSKQDTLCPPFRCRSPSSSEGFPKGRAAARPFVSFQGGAGGNRNPPAFLFRGPGGHSLFKREYPPGFSVPNRYSSAGNPGNLFGKTKRKWGFNPVRHRRTSSHQSGAFDISKEK